MTTVTSLPPYPSQSALKSLSPSHQSTINQTISTALQDTLSLPPNKLNISSAVAFVSSYARDSAAEQLNKLIWVRESSVDKVSPKIDRTIKSRVLSLAEKISQIKSLESQTLIDLSISYTQTHPVRLKRLLSLPSSVAAFTGTSLLVSAFTTLFSPGHIHSSGLYGLRKSAHCLLSLLRPSPSEVTRLFHRDKGFLLALGKAYDDGLSSIALSYGGVRGHLHEGTWKGEIDEWELIWVGTKVAIIDAFHLIVTGMVADLAKTNASIDTGGLVLATEADRAFDIVFGLLELPSGSNSTSNSSTPTPFFDRPLLADYQTTYDLSTTLAHTLSTVSKEAERDARLDLIEAALASMQDKPANQDQSPKKNPGALKILLRASGVQPGIDNLGKHKPAFSTIHKPQSQPDPKGKGKARGPPANMPEAHTDPLLDEKTAQVLSILPDYDPLYIRAFLVRNAEYDGDSKVEDVVEALLEGRAPTMEELTSAGQVDGERDDVVEDVEWHGGNEDEIHEYAKQRANAFDNDVIDLNSFRVGKKAQDETTVLRDRSFIESMKADILRRAEAIALYDSEEEAQDANLEKAGKGKAKVVAYEEELDSDAEGGTHGSVIVGGDGEESGSDGDLDSDDDDGEDAVIEQKQTPETVCELAYIRDPKLFDRDATTRRAKARADLRTATGWGDEQIEGWRIMLERNPNKEKILQKHEFSGNRNQPVVQGSSSHRGGGNRGRGRGNSGGVRGGRGRGGGGDGGDARGRAWKDKNKASRGNHNRKRGHDKKMSRAGAGVPPA